MKLSHPLRMKLLDTNNLKIKSHTSFNESVFTGFEVPSFGLKEVDLDLKDEIELFHECKLWLNTIRNPVENFYYYKADIGEYEGLYPIMCDNNNMKVTFNFDNLYPGRKHWKDWAII